MNWTFRISSLVIGVALAVGAGYALRPRPAEVDVARASKGPLEQTVVDAGRARVRERYTVSAPVAGTLARIELHEGDVVEPGAVLARLLPLPSPLLDPESRKAAEARLASAVDASEQASASVARAQAAADRAKADVTRLEALVKSGAAPAIDLDQATADARMRDAELASTKFAAKVAAHDIAETRAAIATFRPGAAKSEQFEITSPVHGKVLHVLHKSEGVIAAGTALLEVGDPEALELVADVLSQDAVAIRPGMLARVVHWGGDGALAAKVRRVEPAAFTKTSALGVDEQRVNVLLDLEGPLDRFRALGDGFAVEIELTVWSKPDALQIPTSALFRDGEAWSTFVVEGGRVALRPLTLGHRCPLQTEIATGVGVGDVVVVHPSAALRAGARVTHR